MGATVGPGAIVEKPERPYLGIRFETAFNGMFANGLGFEEGFAGRQGRHAGERDSGRCRTPGLCLAP